MLGSKKSWKLSKGIDLIDSHPSLPLNSFRSGNDDYLQFLARKNRTHWLSLAIENRGNAPARDVVVDLTIRDVEEIDLYPPSEPQRPYRDSSGGINIPYLPNVIPPPPSWKTDSKEHVYIDGFFVDKGIGIVRQRVKSVTRGSNEGLISIGLVGPAEKEGLSFNIEYKIAHADGPPIEGQLTVTITIDKTRDYLAEEFAANIANQNK